MKLKLKIWAITADIHNSGIDTELFGSLPEAHAELKRIIEANLLDWQDQPRTGPECDQLRALLDQNKIVEAWDLFMDCGRTHPRHADDWWHFLEHTVEVELPFVTALENACQAFNESVAAYTSEPSAA